MRFTLKRGANRPNNKQSERSFTNAGDHIVKRCSATATLATGGGTAIPLTSQLSGDASSSSEFASFAARYLQYRVRRLRITGKATQPVQTATVTHSALVRGNFVGATAPASTASIVSSESFKSNGTHSDFEHVVTWDGIPDAKLWQPTSAAIPAADQFGIVFASIASPAMTTATTYYVLFAEWEVEFRGTK
jgi:hypothetical protein